MSQRRLAANYGYYWWNLWHTSEHYPTDAHAEAAMVRFLITLQRATALAGGHY